MQKAILSRLTMLVLSLLAASCATDGRRDEVIVFQPDPNQPFDSCIAISRIDSTRVLDDRNILFYMRGGDIFRNWLPRRCPQLAQNDAFSYTTNVSRLCDNDFITVLQRVAGFGGNLGAACNLGGFYPITEPEADALKDEIERVKELGIDF